MILRGMAVAVALIAGAAIVLELSDGQAAVFRGGADGAPAALGMAPLSLGNPSAAAALASMDAHRPIVTGTDKGAKFTPESYVQSFKIKAGDTLGTILQRTGLDGQTIEAAMSELRRVFNPRTLRAGQTIDVTFVPSVKDGENDRFQGFSIPLDYARSVNVHALPDGGFKAFESEKILKTKFERAEGAIDWSLFAAGTDAGVPAAVMNELVRAYSWDVDFQRDIQKNDKFEVLFERKVDESGQAVHTGRILFAALTLSGDRKPIYLHQTAQGNWDYFDDKGQSAKKALMRTPIDGARLSSSFGTRKHPILGYNKKHTGTDFAAPQGTPIYAAGDGVVSEAGWNGGYGKYVSIRHNSEFSTAYAHMRAIDKSVSAGTRVRQGQVIGYVGSTGMSTGAHLHFEVIRMGVKVNPMSVKMPSGEKLKGTEMARFEKSRDKLKTLWASLPGKRQQLAQK